MRTIRFSKMVAAGNDFVLVDNRKGQVSNNKPRFAQKVCNRIFGIGADGLLLLERSKVADVRMRIFNADGSEAEMCGNGARCIAFYAGQGNIKIDTKAGIIESHVKGNDVKIKLTDPKGLKLDIPVKINKRPIRVNFINTGVPHAVVFVEGLERIDAPTLGREIRYHKAFAPAGTNANFVEVMGKKSIKIRTYERGVEDETLACGTGSAASALIFALKTCTSGCIKVHTKSKEILTVYFNRSGDRFKNVWLQGKASVVFNGEINL